MHTTVLRFLCCGEGGTFLACVGAHFFLTMAATLNVNQVLHGKA